MLTRSKPASLKPVKGCWVVEDEEEIRTYLKQELSDEYKVAICCNGKEAYDYILKEMPDLVISDIMMPEMDGFGIVP